MASYQGYSEHYHQQPEVYQYDSSPIPKTPYSDLETVRHSNYGPSQPPPNEKEQSRKICGLRTVTFFLVLALITAILCIAAVGGGLGGALASKNSSGASATKTVTASATGATPAASSAVPDYGFARLYCKNHTIYEAPTGGRFRMYCGIDWAEGDEARDGSGEVTDLVERAAASWESCMDQCSAYNKNNPGLASQNKCNAAAFNADLTYTPGVNCWFKSAAGVRDTIPDTETVPERYAVAELLNG